MTEMQLKTLQSSTGALTAGKEAWHSCPACQLESRRICPPEGQPRE